MLTGNARAGKILLITGLISLFVEVFLIYYTVPSPGNPSVPDHPFLDYMGNGEAYLGNFIVFSSISIGISSIFVRNAKVNLSLYLLGTVFLATGSMLFLYGVQNPVPVSTEIGTVMLQPYGIRGGLTAFAGVVLLAFIAVFQFAVHRDRMKSR